MKTTRVRLYLDDKQTDLINKWLNMKSFALSAVLSLVTNSQVSDLSLSKYQMIKASGVKRKEVSLHKDIVKLLPERLQVLSTDGITSITLNITDSVNVAVYEALHSGLSINIKELTNIENSQL